MVAERHFTNLLPDSSVVTLSMSRIEDWSKVTVVLLNRQIVYLDRLSADIRAKNGVVIKRAEMIRALIDCLAEAKIDPSKISSRDGLKEIFKSQS